MAQPDPFDRLERLLALAGAAEPAELPALLADVRRVAASASFIRAALDPTRLAESRLSVLRRLEALAEGLPQRDRTELAADLRRLAVRAIASEGLMSAPTETRASPLERAEALLGLAAKGALPLGAAGTAALKQARSLLRNEAAQEIIEADADTRRRLLALLAEGEARLR